jgi:hypothetical protein
VDTLCATGPYLAGSACPRFIGDRLGQATALAVMGTVRQLTGDHRGATDALSRALQTFRDLGNRGKWVPGLGRCA